MIFKQHQLDCEILTKYKPSLVCTANNQDIITADNKIKFAKIGKPKDSYDKKSTDIHIGADTTYQNYQLDSKAISKDRWDRYKEGIILRSELRPEGFTWNVSGKDNPFKLALIKLGVISKYDDESGASSLRINYEHKDRFSRNNLVITKNLISSNLSEDILDFTDDLKENKVGATIQSDEIELSPLKMEWNTQSIEGKFSYSTYLIRLINNTTKLLLFGDDKAQFSGGENIMRLMKR